MNGPTTEYEDPNQWYDQRQRYGQQNFELEQYEQQQFDLQRFEQEQNDQDYQAQNQARNIGRSSPYQITPMRSPLLNV